MSVLLPRSTPRRWEYRLLTVEDAAQSLGVHPTRVWKLLRDGELAEKHRAGSRRKHVLASDVERYRARRDRWLKMHGRDGQKKGS